jgi:hypothetical protein
MIDKEDGAVWKVDQDANRCGNGRRRARGCGVTTMKMVRCGSSHVAGAPTRPMVVAADQDGAAWKPVRVQSALENPKSRCANGRG